MPVYIRTATYSYSFQAEQGSITAEAGFLLIVNGKQECHLLTKIANYHTTSDDTNRELPWDFFFNCMVPGLLALWHSEPKTVAVVEFTVWFRRKAHSHISNE